MSVISCFFGIYIRMYHVDHPPAHFHVEYQGHEALVAIETGEVIEGRLPIKATRIVKEWALEHHDALMTNWQRARNLEPLERVPGADND
ncbi:MAG: DUF4160 domain-containing protein [Ramlibacter sp.]|nr:DUF4160 domain-containing protein [Ramlibacter sp.]